MRVNYLSLDRSDLSFAAGSLARGMKSPTTKDLEERKRVGRYLRERPAGAILFEPQNIASRYLRERPVGVIVFEPPTLPGVLEVLGSLARARTYLFSPEK